MKRAKLATRAKDEAAGEVVSKFTPISRLEATPGVTHFASTFTGRTLCGLRTEGWLMGTAGDVDCSDCTEVK